MTRRRHHRLDTAITTLTTTDLNQLAHRLRTAIDRDIPSRPDGYPTRTPGSDPGTAHTPHDNDDRIDLTTVEAAADARTHWHDPHHHHTQAALGYLEDAERALRACLNRLTLIDRLTDTRPAAGEGIDPHDWCSHHLQLGLGCEPRYRGDCCRRCYEFRLAEGYLPPRELLQLKRITAADIAKHAPRRAAARARR